MWYSDDVPGISSRNSTSPPSPAHVGKLNDLAHSSRRLARRIYTTISCSFTVSHADMQTSRPRSDVYCSDVRAAISVELKVHLRLERLVHLQQASRRQQGPSSRTSSHHTGRYLYMYVARLTSDASSPHSSAVCSIVCLSLSHRSIHISLLLLSPAPFSTTLSVHHNNVTQK